MEPARGASGGPEVAQTSGRQAERSVCCLRKSIHHELHVSRGSANERRASGGCLVGGRIWVWVWMFGDEKVEKCFCEHLLGTTVICINLIATLSVGVVAQQSAGGSVLQLALMRFESGAINQRQGEREREMVWLVLRETPASPARPLARSLFIVLQVRVESLHFSFNKYFSTTTAPINTFADSPRQGVGAAIAIESRGRRAACRHLAAPAEVRRGPSSSSRPLGGASCGPRRLVCSTQSRVSRLEARGSGRALFGAQTATCSSASCERPGTSPPAGSRALIGAVQTRPGPATVARRLFTPSV